MKSGNVNPDCTGTSVVASSRPLMLEPYHQIGETVGGREGERETE
eukprot:COSAG03_NODE_2741_length_2486_cov_1.086301_1_plen_44_part_10